MKKIKKQILCVLIMMLVPYFVYLTLNGGERMDSAETTIIVLLEGESVEVQEFQYLVGVLANEIPLDYPIEAIKAQAVIIRTRLYRDREVGEEVAYAYLDSSGIVDKWKDGDIQDVYKKLELAVRETMNTVMMYEDHLIIAPYHTINDGSTVSGEKGFGSDEYPYLQVVECGLDTIVDEENSGHGMGLSQNTAKYMAFESKGYEEILFYFYEDISLVDYQMEI